MKNKIRLFKILAVSALQAGNAYSAQSIASASTSGNQTNSTSKSGTKTVVVGQTASAPVQPAPLNLSSPVAGSTQASMGQDGSSSKENQKKWSVAFSSTLTRSLAQPKNNKPVPTNAANSLSLGYSVTDEDSFALTLNASNQLFEYSEDYGGVTLGDTSVDYNRGGKGFLGTSMYLAGVSVSFGTSENGSLTPASSIKAEEIKEDPKAINQMVASAGLSFAPLWSLGYGFSALYSGALGITHNRVYTPVVVSNGSLNAVGYRREADEDNFEMVNALGLKYSIGAGFSVSAVGSLATNLTKDDEKVGSSVGFGYLNGNFLGTLKVKDSFAISSSAGTWRPFENDTKQKIELALSYAL